MSQNRRSADGSRPPIFIDTRNALAESLPNQTSRTVHFPDSPLRDSPAEKSPHVARRLPPRIIRTFEEIERVVPQEEWYEELECGICSHILGAPQALVPCGHSFCGPCAWTWIKINDNHTCPHCRVPVNEVIPLVPNIVVDQIIDRKLSGLPDGKEKADHVIERTTKASEWKVLQSSIVPPRPAPKRTRGPFESLSGMFDLNSGERSGHQRRASRHLPELGPPMPAPRRTGAYVGLNLSEVARLDAAENGRAQSDPQVSAARRVRDSVLSGQSRTFRSGEVPPVQSFPSQAAGSEQRAIPVLANTPERQPSPQIVTPSRRRTESGGSQVDFSPGRIPPGDRSGITRSDAFLSRQARGRDGASRDRPLSIDTDSDGE